MAYKYIFFKRWLYPLCFIHSKYKRTQAHKMQARQFSGKKEWHSKNGTSSYFFEW